MVQMVYYWLINLFPKYDFVYSCVLSVFEANGEIQSGVSRNNSLVCLLTCNADMSATTFSNSQNISLKLQSAATIRTYNGITMTLIQERVIKDGLSKDVKRTSIFLVNDVNAQTLCSNRHCPLQAAPIFYPRIPHIFIQSDSKEHMGSLACNYSWVHELII